VIRRGSRPVECERHFGLLRRWAACADLSIAVPVDINKGSRCRGARSFVSAPSRTSLRRLRGALNAMGANPASERARTYRISRSEPGPGSGQVIRALSDAGAELSAPIALATPRPVALAQAWWPPAWRGRPLV
jgi:hypothetical protein